MQILLRLTLQAGAEQSAGLLFPWFTTLASHHVGSQQ